MSSGAGFQARLQGSPRVILFATFNSLKLHGREGQYVPRLPPSWTFPLGFVPWPISDAEHPARG